MNMIFIINLPYPSVFVKFYWFRIEFSIFVRNWSFSWALWQIGLLITTSHYLPAGRPRSPLRVGAGLPAQSFTFVSHGQSDLSYARFSWWNLTTSTACDIVTAKR